MKENNYAIKLTGIILRHKLLSCFNPSLLPQTQRKVKAKFPLELCCYVTFNYKFNTVTLVENTCCNQKVLRTGP